MKKLTLALAVIFGVITFSSCTKENVQPTSAKVNAVSLSGDKGTLSQADFADPSGDKGTLSQADASLSGDKGTLSQADAAFATSTTTTAKTKKK